MALSPVQSQYLENQAYMDCSQATAAEVDREIQELLARVYGEAKDILLHNRSLLDEIAQYLLIKETITCAELMAYIEADQKAAQKTEETPAAPAGEGDAQ